MMSSIRNWMRTSFRPVVTLAFGGMFLLAAVSYWWNEKPLAAIATLVAVGLLVIGRANQLRRREVT